MSSDAALRVAPRDRLLGELLLDAGLVGAADLERGLALQQKIGGRIGSVLMRIGAVSEDNLLQVLSRQLGLPVMGADVPAPELARIRQPFTRLTSSRGQLPCARLGLAIVERIAALHRGQLRLENREQGGLAAMIELPAATEKEAELLGPTE